ncbi:hypothetical protein ACP70R_019073 [Stipagrostis hirtigluma subsp. patula]
MESASSSPPRVCVTGGGGFIASWLVKLLLSRGYAVHATLRDPDDPKNAHLRQLDGARENLRLFKADVLEYDTLTPAVEGCEGLFHLATPVPEHEVADPQSEVLDPAVKGTLNVLKVCSRMKVQKVVVMSSNAAVNSNPNWPHDRLKDESCWSNKEFCMEHKDWYSIAKIEAEQEALEYADKNGLIRGPDVINNRMWHIVDVRDVADALLLVYEKKESYGRYICSSNHICTRDLVDLLKKMYPNIIDADHKASVTCQKLRIWAGNQGTWRRRSQIAWSVMKRQAFSRMQPEIIAVFPFSSVHGR